MPRQARLSAPGEHDAALYGWTAEAMSIRQAAGTVVDDQFRKKNPSKAIQFSFFRYVPAASVTDRRSALTPASSCGSNG